MANPRERMIVVQCRSCKAIYSVRKSRIGLVAKCSNCQSGFKIPRMSIYFNFYHIFVMIFISLFGVLFLLLQFEEYIIYHVPPIVTLIFISCIVIFPFIPAVIARNKGHDFFIWWAYGFFLLPIALIHAILWTSNKENVESELVFNEQIRKGSL